MDRNRTRWLALTPCLSAPSEVAERVVLVAEEDPERERRRQSASAHAGGDVVDMVVCVTVRGCVWPVQGSRMYV